jgi:molybdopterin/thiamine biosynthesis adenylyltransferase
MANSAVSGVRVEAGSWNYEEATSRNLGLITSEEQVRLRGARIAIPGMGGVGGVHLMTLVRLGVGAFNIADPDSYEVANLNRQYGAATTTLGRSKVRTMAEHALGVNPALKLRVFEEPILADNVEAFLEGVNLVVDGLDFFALAARRILFREAARRGLYVITAGPIGFSSAMLVFDPKGMSFDDYFDLRDDQDEVNQLVRFGVGLTPKATHLQYMDLSRVSMEARKGPSLGLATNLCAALVATEVVRILLERGPVKAAPHYVQLDAMGCVYKRGYLPWGNRNPVQRFKLWFVGRRYI